MRSNTLFSSWLSLLFCIAFSQIQAQSLASRLKGIDDFATIQSMSEMYYDSIAKGLRTRHPEDRKYKHWKREEEFLSRHLGPDGKLVNYVVKNMEANDVVSREFASSTRATHSNWVFNGPSGHYITPSTYHYIGKGRVDRITFHPTNANTFIVGTPNAGAWKTTNAGVNWYCVNDNLPAMGVSGIQYAKSNPNIVYMLTGCGDGGGSFPTAGVFKSIDGGETWSKTSNFSFSIDESITAYEIAVSDVNENKVAIATNIGIYTTVNGGTSWSLVYPSTMSTGTYYDVTWKPNSQSELYAVTSTNFYKVNLSTGTWVLESQHSFPSGRKSLAVSPHNASYVYIISGPATAAGVFNGCWLSINSGASFTLMSNTPNVWGGEGGAGTDDQSSYDNCFTAHPLNESIVVMGGLVTNKSIDSGQNWTSITTYGAGSSSPNYVHPDIHDVKINPLNGYLYNCNDGGIYVSTDLGTTWSNITNDLHTTQFYHMASYNPDRNYFAGGAQDNGVKYRSYATTLMDHVGGADGYQPAFNPTDPSMFYISINEGFYKYTNYGATIAGPFNPNGNFWFQEVATHPTDGNVVYVGTDKFHISLNQGATWSTVNAPSHNAIAVAPSNGAKMYSIGAGGRQAYQINGLTGTTFIALHTSPGFPSSGVVSDISVHPSNDLNICITVGGYVAGKKVYSSTDGGLNWTNRSYNLPDIPFNCSAYALNGDLFVGSEVGVFYLPNGTTTWVLFRNNMPAVSVRDIHIFESDNIVRACTYGRGIWQTNKPDGVCAAALLLFNPISGYHFTEVSNNLLITSLVSGGYGTNVYFKSNNYIEFRDGFEAKDNGTLLKAYISACGTNLPPP